ncbi:MAG: YdbH domain-containing protein [Verrucomicrobiota bacterium JB022]|nr:YdbH domain-containing protein [Verrucomicrobiota bacterium JB022]
MPLAAGTLVGGALAVNAIRQGLPGWVENWLEGWVAQDVGGQLDLEVASASLSHLDAPQLNWTGPGWELQGEGAQADYFWLPGQPFALQYLGFDSLTLTLDPSQTIAWPEPARPATTAAALPPPREVPLAPPLPQDGPPPAPPVVAPVAETRPPPAPTVEPDPVELPTAPVATAPEPWPVPAVPPQWLPRWDGDALETVLQGLWDFQIGAVTVPQGELRILRGEEAPLTWPWQLHWQDDGRELTGAFEGQGASLDLHLAVDGVRPEWTELSLSLDMAGREAWTPWLESFAVEAPAGLEWGGAQAEALFRARPGEAPHTALLIEGQNWRYDDGEGLTAGLERIVLAAEGHDWDDLEVNGALRSHALSFGDWQVDPFDVIVKYPAPRYLKVEVPNLVARQGDAIHARAAFRAFVQAPWKHPQPQAEWELALQEAHLLSESQPHSLEPFSIFGKAIAGGWSVQASPISVAEFPDWSLADIEGAVHTFRQAAEVSAELRSRNVPLLNLAAQVDGLSPLDAVAWQIRSPGEAPATDLEGTVDLSGEAPVVAWQGKLAAGLLEAVRAFLPSDWADLQAQGSLAFGSSELTLGEQPTGVVELRPQLTQLGSAAQGWQLRDLNGTLRLANPYGFWLPQGPETHLTLARASSPGTPEWDLRGLSLKMPTEAPHAQLHAVMHDGLTGARALDVQAEADWTQGYTLQSTLQSFPPAGQKPLVLKLDARATLLPLVDRVTLQGGGALGSLGPLKALLGPAWAGVRFGGQLEVSGEAGRANLLDYTGHARLQIRDGSLTWAEGRTTTGLNTTVQLVYQGNQLRSDGPQTLTIAEVKQGEEVLKNVSVRFNLTAYPQLAVEEVVAEWRGGQVTLEPFVYDFANPVFETTVHLKGVEAQPIVTQLMGSALEFIARSGQVKGAILPLSGYLPVRYDHGRLSADKGELSLTTPNQPLVRLTDRELAEKYLNLGEQVPPTLRPAVVNAALNGLQVEYFRARMFDPKTPLQPLVLELGVAARTKELELEGVHIRMPINLFGDREQGQHTSFEQALWAVLHIGLPAPRR